MWGEIAAPRTRQEVRGHYPTAPENVGEADLPRSRRPFPVGDLLNGARNRNPRVAGKSRCIHAASWIRASSPFHARSVASRVSKLLGVGVGESGSSLMFQTGSGGSTASGQSLVAAARSVLGDGDSTDCGILKRQENSGGAIGTSPMF